MWFSQEKRKRAFISRGRRLTFDQLEDRTLLSISYPVDPGVVAVEGGTLTANYIPVDNLTIDTNAAVELTPLPGNPTEDLSIKNAANNGLLDITGGNKTIGTISGTGDTTVSDGATLTVTSIVQNTVTVGAGSTLEIAPCPGGPLSGDSENSSTTTIDPNTYSAVMDGGTVHYCSDALPNLSAANDAQLICTDPMTVTVEDGTLHVDSYPSGIVTVTPGANIVVEPTPDGPWMDGGTLHYNTKVLPNVTAVNDAILVQTDQSDLSNAWRSTETVVGGDPILFDIMGPDGSTTSRNTDPSTWPEHDMNDTDTRTPELSTVYKNRFDKIIAAEQSYEDLAWNGTISDHIDDSAGHWNYDGNEQLYGEGSIVSIVPATDKLVVTPSNVGETGLLTYGYEGEPYSLTYFRDGIEQLTCYSDGTVVCGGQTYTMSNYPGTHADSSTPDVSPSSLRGRYKGPYIDVISGTGWFEYLLGYGADPPGDFGQPASKSFGFVHRNDDGSISVLIGLYGPNTPGGHSCNTIKNGVNAGTIIASLKYSPHLTVTYLVQATLCCTVTSDPNSTQPAIGEVSWTIKPGPGSTGGAEVGSRTTVGPANPITTGNMRSDMSSYAAFITVAPNSTIITIDVRMADGGSGNVIYYIWFKIDEWSSWPPLEIADGEAGVNSNTIPVDEPSNDIISGSKDTQTESVVNILPLFVTSANIKIDPVATSNIKEDFEIDPIPLVRDHKNLKADRFTDHLNTEWWDRNRKIDSQDRGLLVSPPSWFHGVGIALIEPLYVGVK